MSKEIIERQSLALYTLLFVVLCAAGQKRIVGLKHYNIVCARVSVQCVCDVCNGDKTPLTFLQHV